MQDIQSRKQAWLQAKEVTEQDKESIRAMDETALTDSFFRPLAFGTGGLRGEIGMGDNRMNLYTVRQATKGLADYLLASGLARRVAIAYDSRIMSAEFAHAAAEVLASCGITALVYPRLEPTPSLSFAVRDQRCGAGICVTASHNPAKYNGYKVYGPDGCQITLEAANSIQAAIRRTPLFGAQAPIPFEEGLKTGSIAYLGEDVLERFLDAVQQESLRPELKDEPLSVVYTPLNGTGRECVTRILQRNGVNNLHVVAEQEKPDGHFPTCPYPNPEIREALQLGIRDCKVFHPDLLLATDPDCDRVGIAVMKDGDAQLMTGNEVGILLLDYICRTRREKDKMPERPVAVTTIVSSAMADAVAKTYGVELRRTLTGFKFIGEQIGMLEKAGEKERYIFGFEESYGYLSGAHVRDKDGVNASLLICEMAKWYRKQGMTLLDAMDALYRRYGYYYNNLHNYTFEGAAGMDVMAGIMARLRKMPPAVMGGMAVEQVVDYLQDGTGLPRADVLEYRLQGGAKVMVRPSGTEPKLKSYTFTTGKNRQAAQAVEEQLSRWLETQLR